MKLKIIIKSYSCYHIHMITNVIKEKSKKENIKIKGPIFMPKKKTIMNILRSPHVDKDSRDQIGLEKYKTIFIVENINKEKLKILEVININPILQINYKFLK